MLAVQSRAAKSWVPLLKALRALSGTLSSRNETVGERNFPALAWSPLIGRDWPADTTGIRKQQRQKETVARVPVMGAPLPEERSSSNWTHCEEEAAWACGEIPDVYKVSY